MSPGSMITEPCANDISLISGSRKAIVSRGMAASSRLDMVGASVIECDFWSVGSMLCGVAGGRPLLRTQSGRLDVLVLTQQTRAFAIRGQSAEVTAGRPDRSGLQRTLF